MTSMHCITTSRNHENRIRRTVVILAMLTIAVTTALMMPVLSYADTMEDNPQEKSGVPESMQINVWRNGSFTSAGSTTDYWFPDVYRINVTKTGTYSIMLETLKASSDTSGIVLVLSDYYSIDSYKNQVYGPVCWVGLVSYPLGYCYEVDLDPGTYWLMVGDAYDIYDGLSNPFYYDFDIDPLSDEIFDFLDEVYPDSNYVGTYRLGIFSRPNGSAPVYRMYNRRTSEHLYTKSVNEYTACGVGNYADWEQEGIAWYAPKKSSTPVYRLYNKGLLVHHYTCSRTERDKLVSQYGWRDEGVAFYSDDAHGKPLYRLYNGSIRPPQHHYTSSAGERDSLVKKYGWRNEGVGFYGMKQ